MNIAQLLLGLLLLVVSTAVAVILRRHLDHPDNPRSAPGTAMNLLIVNLVQVLGLAVVVFAIFEPGN